MFHIYRTDASGTRWIKSTDDENAARTFVLFANHITGIGQTRWDGAVYAYGTEA